MLDIAIIRSNPGLVRDAVARKGEHCDIDVILELDEQRRKLQFEGDSLREMKNKSSQEIANLKREGKDASVLIARMKEISSAIKDIEEKEKEIAGRLEKLLVLLPNIPAAEVPTGKTSNENLEIKRWGQQRKFDFEPRPHWDVAAALEIIDMERAARMTGSNFVMFMGKGAMLERALINFMLDLHTKEHGYTEVSPPFLVNRRSMFGTGQLPKLEDDMYRTTEDDFFLIPTAEVPITNIHQDEILSYQQLPLYYTAYSPCFRREAGSYGAETRGLIRVHQFDKVELVKFTRQETSFDELEKLLADAEKVLQLLGLHYRVVLLCTGEMSLASAKTYDIEVWAPGCKKWLEVSSCSNFTDFQARRINVRYRDENGKVRFVHTLNGSGIALPRTVIAILENYQRADGKVDVPDVLQPYMGGLKVIG